MRSGALALQRLCTRVLEKLQRAPGLALRSAEQVVATMDTELMVVATVTLMTFTMALVARRVVIISVTIDVVVPAVVYW